MKIDLGLVKVKTSGFTLVELVIVILILGIIAAIAMPIYVDLQKEAKISTTRAALGAVRTAIENYRLKSIAETTATVMVYPTYYEVYEAPGHPSTIMYGGDMPDNPFSTTSKWGTPDKDRVYLATTQPKGTLIESGTEGWCYRPTESSPGAGDAGEFWANTNTPGVNENSF